MSPARRLSLPARSQRPAPRPRPPLPRCLLLCQLLRALRGRWWKRKGQDPGHCEEGPCPSRAPSPGWPGLAAGALWVLLDSARVFFPPGEPVDADLAPSSPPSCGLVPLPGPAVLDQLPRVPRLPRTPRVCVCARVTGPSGGDFVHQRMQGVDSCCPAGLCSSSVSVSLGQPRGALAPG